MTVEDTIQLSNYALDAGADGVMIVSPYYFALSDESIEYYYDQVAEAVKGDIICTISPPERSMTCLRK